LLLYTFGIFPVICFMRHASKLASDLIFYSHDKSLLKL
jgi:hypothetical protein